MKSLSSIKRVKIDFNFEHKRANSLTHLKPGVDKEMDITRIYDSKERRRRLACAVAKRRTLTKKKKKKNFYRAKSISCANGIHAIRMAVKRLDSEASMEEAAKSILVTRPILNLVRPDYSSSLLINEAKRQRQQRAKTAGNKSELMENVNRYRSILEECDRNMREESDEVSIYSLYKKKGRKRREMSSAPMSPLLRKKDGKAWKKGELLIEMKKVEKMRGRSSIFSKNFTMLKDITTKHGA